MKRRRVDEMVEFIIPVSSLDHQKAFFLFSLWGFIFARSINLCLQTYTHTHTQATKQAIIILPLSPTHSVCLVEANHTTSISKVAVNELEAPSGKYLIRGSAAAGHPVRKTRKEKMSSGCLFCPLSSLLSAFTLLSGRLFRSHWRVCVPDFQSKPQGVCTPAY